MSFRVAILEEAGKATAPEALMVVLRASKSILVGDSRQLPPHPWGPMQAVLYDPDTLTTRDPDRAAEADELRAAIRALGSTPQQREAAGQETLFDHFAVSLRPTKHELTLNMQYRMLPPIGELVSEVFYNDIGGLQHRRKKPIDPRVSAYAGEVRVKLVDIPGQEERGPDGKSKLRPAEVEYIRTELRAIQQHAASTGPPPEGPQRLGVAVISPYAAQARYLRKHLDLTRYPALNVRVGIVDSFQGDEDQVVILSIAATTVAGFLYVPNRINVAVSRAQDLLIVTTSLPAAIRDSIGKPLGDVARFVNRKVQAGDPAYQVLRPRQRSR
jgi:superfamily I DNA and/or RNA helicase